MDAMFQATNSSASTPCKTASIEALAIEIGQLLSEQRGVDVVVMDMRKINFWTDFFIISTVSSTVLSAGLERRIKDYAAEHDIEILRHAQKQLEGDEWRLIDLGSIVIHLMSAGARSFYELERLWDESSIIYSNAGPVL
ncbi:ribosome silencing factor [Breznakiellaceae bacterium SP9]